MLPLCDVELKQTRFYQEVAAEGEAKLLKRLLSKRFGTLPAHVIAQLEQAVTEQLEKWGEQIFEAKS